MKCQTLLQCPETCFAPRRPGKRLEKCASILPHCNAYYFDTIVKDVRYTYFVYFLSPVPNIDLRSMQPLCKQQIDQGAPEWGHKVAR